MASFKHFAKRTAQGVGAIFALSVLALAIVGGEAREARKEAQQIEKFVSSTPIYKPGTFGYDLNKLGKMIGVDVPIVFLDTDDLESYGKDFVNDPRAQRVADRVKAYAVSSTQGRSDRERRQQISILAFVPQDKSLHALGACPIVITNALKKQPEANQAPVLMHEMTHCQDFYLRRTDHAGYEAIYDQVKGLVPVDQRRLPGMAKTIDTVFAESLPTATLRALSFADDPDIRQFAQAGFADELRTARSGSTANESPAVAEAMTQICAKTGDCPTQLGPLQKLLSKDPRYLAAMSADIERFYALKGDKL
ncbi:hypothetical protein N7645_15185 [Pseudomonas juntendi]|uniref:hypothetical protein n=1 Tax=Pseudomonas TaxID=286 RepID=UPI0012AE8A8F|nr:MULTISPECIES: hypothetical protein [Pseudomonas]MDG9918232.1 hypothetical protein [Pseudomonas juntendi]MDH0507680.1 hypothetical protein [Pseudomonas juntendi]MDH1044838.1 hypothetical protein [Pseudomonas juntendi]MRT62347.1 hypothetical protein [Pseudomonas sp. CAH-1]